MAFKQPFISTTMTKKILTAADFTPDVIDALKAEHGDLFTVTVAESSVKYDPFMVPKDEDEPLDGLVGYLRKPTDKELGFAMSKLPSILDAGKVIVKNCWVGGDERIKTETALLGAAAMQVIELLEVRQAQLKKL